MSELMPSGLPKLDPSKESGCGAVLAALVVGLGLAFTLFLVFTSGGDLRIPFTPDQPPGPGGDNGPGDGGAGNTVTYSGSDATGEMPIISLRDFTGGEAPLTVSGAFTFGDTIALHPPAAFADGTETTLVYGDYPIGPGISLGFSRLDGSEGLGLVVNSGDWIATYLGQGCSWEVEVSATSLSGHIECTDIPAYNNADGSAGSIDIELDFSADSPAGDAEPSA